MRAAYRPGGRLLADYFLVRHGSYDVASFSVHGTG
jgi:hypothetical protein